MLLPAVSFLALAATVSAAALPAHESGGTEHIVLISNDQRVPPAIEDILDRLALTTSHPDVKYIYNNTAFRGFSASMKSHCLDLLANMSDISTVEQAASIESMRLPSKRSGHARSRGQGHSLTRDEPYYQTRPSAPWGLQRISTGSTVSGSASSLDFTYSFAASSLGAGADIYILDSGIYTQHSVFGGRANMSWSYDGQMTDQDGHGTHVAGTAGGAVLGVASEANILGVRALDADGGGWSSNVVAGIDYVIQRHDARKTDPGFVGSVLSMSLASSGQAVSITSAVRAAISAGVHTVVAAGNSAGDACDFSPASAGGGTGPAITVGSVDMSAARSSFSNTGTCVDVYAPGEDVISSWIGAPNMVNILSGTSMATPHVSGLVAYAMANRTLAADPALMKAWIVSSALPQQEGYVLLNNGVTA